MRRIYWRVGKDTGYFDDLKTLEGATRRLARRIPDWREIEVQFDVPVGSPGDRLVEKGFLRHTILGTPYFTDAVSEVAE